MSKECVYCGRRGIRGFGHWPPATVNLTDGTPYTVEAMDWCTARKACIGRVKAAAGRQPGITADEFRREIEAMEGDVP